MNKPSRLVIDAVPATAFTAREYQEMLKSGAFGDLRVELVCGELQKMMPSYLSHGEANSRLDVALANAYSSSDHQVAIDLIIEIDILTVRTADIAVARIGAPRDRAVAGADIILVVEIADTTLGRDLGLKLADYARAGVPDYWVADLGAGVMHVMSEPDGTTYARRSVVPFGAPLAVPGTNETLTLA